MENLITEGRYDQVTTELSREIINTVKRGIKRYQTQITLFSRTIVDISVYFHYNDEEPIDVSAGTYINPKEIRPHYKNKRIVFHVNVPKTESLKLQKMTVLVPEVKNIVRHEIEHVAQAKFTDRARKGFFSSKRGYYSDEAAAKGKGITYVQYLLEPYEVEAYVRGLYKKAKTLKQPLNVLLDDWENYLLESTDLTDEQIEMVMTKWVEYAKKHLSANEYRKYGYIENFETINEAIGFRASYMKPDVNVTMSFDVPNAEIDEEGNVVITTVGDGVKKNLKSVLRNVLESESVNINSIEVGSGKHKSCNLNFGIFTSSRNGIIDKIGSVESRLHMLMVGYNARVVDVKTNYTYI